MFRERLGRLTWWDLHVYARHDASPDIDMVFSVLEAHYPCDLCRRHLCRTLQGLPSSDTPVLRVFNLHNVINLQLGKPPFPKSGLEVRYGRQKTYYKSNLYGLTYAGWTRRLQYNAARARA